MKATIVICTLVVVAMLGGIWYSQRPPTCDNECRHDREVQELSCKFKGYDWTYCQEKVNEDILKYGK